MSKDKNKYKSTVGFTDLLFNLLIGFVFLFIISFILINPIPKQKDIEAHAEIMVILTWDSELDYDIDLWILDPERNIMSFRQKDQGIVFLDRDDLGHRNDTIIKRDGEKIRVNINREVATIRGIISGEYIVNAHFYNAKDDEGILWPKGAQAPLPPPVTVKVSIIKINPYSEKFTAEQTFTQIGYEHTFTRFTVKPDGKLINFNDRAYPIANSLKGNNIEMMDR